MSSLDEYQNLGKDLSGYVAEVRTNSGASGLQEAFKSGGKLFDVMQMLDKKEKAVRNYEEQLLKAFDPQNPGEITRDYVNKRTAENEAELAEIKLLKDRLTDLSSSVGQKTSGFAITRAVNEFSEGIEKHEKVSKGFFSTFASFIGNIFKGKDEQKLAQASNSLETRSSAISNESQERFAIPGKGKDAPEIPQPEQVVQKDMSSQQLGGFTEPPIDLPPPMPTDLNVGGIPKPPPMPTDLNVGGIPKPPPMPTDLNVGGIPKPPPPPSDLNVGGIPKPPPMPTDLNVGGMPPPMNKTGTPPPPPPPMDNIPKVAPKKDTPRVGDVFKELLAKTNKKKVSLNHKDYAHVSTEPKVEIPSDGMQNVLQGALQARSGGGESEIPIEQRLLDGASKKDQENILYSAMVDNNEKLVADLLKHQFEFNTGEQRENDDGWEEDIVEKRSTFSAERVEAIRKAAEETKHRVVNGIDLVTAKEQEPKTVPIAPKVEEQQVGPVKVENVSPPPPPPIREIGGGVPPPPSPLKETVVKEPKTPPLKPIVAPDKGDLLAQIREGGLKNLKNVSQGQSLNSEEFTYTASKENKPSLPSEGLGGVLANALQAMRQGGIEDTEELDEQMSEKLEKLSSKQQLNELYSAVIDGDKERIARIVDVGNPEVFTPENMEKIANAAQKVSATQEIAKKTIIESGVKILAKEAEINIGVGENRGR